VLPGKKGISLPMNQYSALIELLPYIEKELTETGETVPRPQYDGFVGEEDAGDEEEEDIKDEAEPDGDNDSDSAPKKSNIEATSDEEEDD